MRHPIIYESLANQKISEIRNEGLTNQALRRAGATGNSKPGLFRRFIRWLGKGPTGMASRKERLPARVAYQHDLDTN